MREGDHREPTSGARRARQDPVLKFFMFVGGVILMLPGLCSLFFIIAEPRWEVSPMLVMLIIFWIAFFLMGYLGFTYIKRALS